MKHKTEMQAKLAEQKSKIVLPKKFTHRHYVKAADAVMDAIGITPDEWGDVRYAIKMALEGHLKA